jgi:hypothetical protein
VPLDTARDGRDLQRAGQHAGDLLRLVVAAVVAALAMQRHRDERVELAADARELREQQRESSPHGARAVVLERLHVVIEGRPVRERRDDGVDMPRGLRAGAMRHRPREPAPQARVRDARELRGAHAAKAAARGQAAGRAALDEQAAENPVNHGTSHAVDSARRRL